MVRYQVAIKKRYTKLEREVASDKILSTKPHNKPVDHVDKSDHMTNKTRIYITTRPIATKLEKMLVYDKEPLVLSTTWSCEVTWKITGVTYLLRRGLRQLKLTELWLRKRGHHPQWSHNTVVTWNMARTIKKCFIFISTWVMATKLNKAMACDIRPPRTKSNYSLITWSYIVSWQIKTSPISQVLWTPNLIGRWFMTWFMGPPLKNHFTLSKMFFPFIIFFYSSNVHLVLNKSSIRLLLLVIE